MSYLGQFDISKYINQINPATGMYWTTDQIATQEGVSIADVQTALTRAQTANAVAVGAIPVNDAVSMVQDAAQNPAAYQPGYVEGLVSGLQAQGIPIEAPISIQPPVETGTGPITPTADAPAPGQTVAGPVNINTAPGPAPSTPITSGSPTGVNVNVGPGGAAPQSPAYWNKAGLPYTNEPEAYWYDQADGQWYMGEKATGAITLLAGPPFPVDQYHNPIVAGKGIGLGTIALIVGGVILLGKGLFK